MPWGSVSLVETPYQQPGTQAFYATVHGPDCDVSFHGAPATDESLKRLASCVAMIHMPTEGVDEALTAMKDCWDFYQDREPRPLSPPMIVSSEAKTVSHAERPPLVIAS